MVRIVNTGCALRATGVIHIVHFLCTFIGVKIMGLFSQNMEKKRAKEIKHDIKELSKTLVHAGMDYAKVKAYLDVLFKVMLEACIQQEKYVQSKRNMKEMEILLLEMLSEFDRAYREKVCEQLKQMLNLFDDVYHECTIRQDDGDFASTCAYIKKTALQYEESNQLMLQSELENLLHVVEETIEWEAPNFMALAYFCIYGNRDDLADIENKQRNEMIMRFYKEQFWNEFSEELHGCGEEPQLISWIEEKLKQGEVE